VFTTVDRATERWQHRHKAHHRYAHLREGRYYGSSLTVPYTMHFRKMHLIN